MWKSQKTRGKHRNKLCSNCNILGENLQTSSLDMSLFSDVFLNLSFIPTWQNIFSSCFAIPAFIRAHDADYPKKYKQGNTDGWTATKLFNIEGGCANCLLVLLCTNITKSPLTQTLKWLQLTLWVSILASFTGGNKSLLCTQSTSNKITHVTPHPHPGGRWRMRCGGVAALIMWPHWPTTFHTRIWMFWISILSAVWLTYHL